MCCIYFRCYLCDHSVTGIRKAIINAIPVQLKLAIGSGIGFFIAFVGLKNAGIIVANESTFVGIGNLADPTVLLAVFGLLITIALVIKKFLLPYLLEWSSLL